MAERHVREGEHHVARQREIIAHLSEHGRSIELAERLLFNLEDLLKLHREHLDRIKTQHLKGVLRISGIFRNERNFRGLNIRAARAILGSAD